MESFRYHDLGRIAYADALEYQTAAFEVLLDAKATGKKEDNQLFFCEHLPVLTIGKSGKDSNLLIPEETLRERGVSFYHINRGGDITYHGPGQITGYPVFDLEYWNLGLKQYIHMLEETIIRFLSLYDLKGERLEGATGVWLDPEVPGFALNINTVLIYFSLINPCGFTDKGVTSLAMELGVPQDFELAKSQLRSIFMEIFA